MRRLGGIESFGVVRGVRLPKSWHVVFAIASSPRNFKGVKAVVASEGNYMTLRT